MSEAAVELIREGYKARREARSGDAKGLFMKAAALAAEEQNVSLRADALRGWANSERDPRDFDAANGRYTEAVSLLRTLKDPLRLAHTIRHLGDVTRHQGKLEQSAACYEEALRMYRGQESREALDAANLLRGYGLTLEAMGSVAAAREVWEEALLLYQGVGVAAGVDEAERRLKELAS